MGGVLHAEGVLKSVEGYDDICYDVGTIRQKIKRKKDASMANRY